MSDMTDEEWPQLLSTNGEPLSEEETLRTWDAYREDRLAGFVKFIKWLEVNCREDVTPEEDDR